MISTEKLNLLRFHFNIRTVSDWARVTPDEVLAQPDIGPATLNEIRYILAGQGVTLHEDQTPEYWQSRLIRTTIGSLTYRDEDRSVVAPFTILIDEQEKLPWTFVGLTADADNESRPLIVPTIRKSLGPTHGDYSLAGHEGLVAIDRKSIDDCISTVLGWGERREQFMRTLEYLAGLRASAIVIEGTFETVLASAYATNNKTAAENRKILHRQILAWMQDFNTPWIFCDDRRFAEKTTFQILRRHHQKYIERAKRA
jgi:hypothetical protein